MSAGPSWYDVLDVEPDASPEEIRAAWRAGIADLDPTERRFRSLNQAAEVLLDEQSRAAYDAELAGGGAPSAGRGASTPSAGRGASGASHETPAAGKRPRLQRREKTATSAAGRGASAASHETPGSTAPSRLPLVPAWLLVLAAVLATLGVVTATLASVQAGEPVSDEGGALVEQSAEEARAAAVRAIVPVLSYDYRTLEEDAAAARSYMTSAYQEEKYDPLFEVIAENAPRTETVVGPVQVVDSAVSRAGNDRVQILLFVDRARTNAQVEEPDVFKDQVTVTMVPSEGQWLIDDLATTPIAD
ncbi:J domain-containing protein [Nocardioides sp.]|uniref:J domain-containing protein n=1 Tax=Nocardioides sp. TaxID=35761 RepID=UPI002623BB94|nr:J domain-containing protein [Nocardioides sp.]